ncbi:MAG: peptidoglycan-associated lipoprotein Pal [Pseudoxanthomonas sp.]|nr:peptidoglycan-associated lipoprotein Pal [Pseudoxanthomonas sp.]
MNVAIRISLAALLAFGLVACKKKTVRDEVEPPVDTTPPVAQTTPAGDDWSDPSALDRIPCLRQRVVYFDFDQANVRSEAQEILSCHARYLSNRSMARVTLEGHADERGSREYNLGLGERRGNAARDALTVAGASSGQLTVVSYGEERPTCTMSDESCWQQNRRVEIVYTVR